MHTVYLGKAAIEIIYSFNRVMKIKEFCKIINATKTIKKEQQIQLYYTTSVLERTEIRTKTKEKTCTTEENIDNTGC